MNVLMLGWEFPPHFAGGVGVVCEALSRALAERGDEVTFVMPRGPAGAASPRVRLVVASSPARGVRVLQVGSLLAAYQTTAGYRVAWRQAAVQRREESGEPLYGQHLLDEVRAFGARVVGVVEHVGGSFDVIHAHDWTTFPAGIELQERLGRPLVVHVHITEFDKSGGGSADPAIYDIERAGMHAADLVIAVSERVKSQCADRYQVDPRKIRVVHNAVARGAPGPKPPQKRGKLVLFLGRVTLQKGPDWYVEAARRVLDVDPDVTFVLAGAGDMVPRLVLRAADLRMGSRMLFTGFVDRAQAAQLYALADVFVMPSVSEPFGLVALEAMDRGVPVLLSRQSGVNEVVANALKFDFWDVDDVADKILAALSYPTLARELRSQGDREVERLSWPAAAAKVHAIYRETRNRAGRTASTRTPT